MSSALKKDLHALIDALPDEELPTARRYLEYLRDVGDDSYAHLDASDEMSSEDRQKLHDSLKRGLTEARAGQGKPVEDFPDALKEP